MIYLPIGKAITPVSANLFCKKECVNEDYKCPVKDCCAGCEANDCDALICSAEEREDGQNVIFKIIDCPV